MKDTNFPHSQQYLGSQLKNKVGKANKKEHTYQKGHFVFLYFKFWYLNAIIPLEWLFWKLGDSYTHLSI